MIASAALVAILSGFNGLENLVEDLIGTFDSEIRIEPKKGKTFRLDTFPFDEIDENKGIADYSKIIEEVTLIKYDDKWIPATMKGVEDSYVGLNGIDSMVRWGSFYLDSNDFNFTVLGYTLQDKLGVPWDYSQLRWSRISIYAPLRKKSFRKEKEPFNVGSIMVSGTYYNTGEVDSKYYLVPFSFASDILEYNREITAIEIATSPTVTPEELKVELMALLGDGFSVKTRYEQNELLFRTTKTEKWISYCILVFVLMIATFNIMASMTMLIIDKKKDIQILSGMGARFRAIRNIFFLEGFMINIIGAFIGVILGLLLVWSQQLWGWVGLENSIVDSFPVKIKFSDLVFILITVFSVGIISSFLTSGLLIKRYYGSTDTL